MLSSDSYRLYVRRETWSNSAHLACVSPFSVLNCFSVNFTISQLLYHTNTLLTSGFSVILALFIVYKGVIFTAINRKGDKILYHDNSTFVIDAIGRTLVSNCSVQSHNRCHRSLDLIGRLFFIHLDVPCLVDSRVHVIHHPSTRKIPTLRYILLQHEFHQFLCRRTNIPKILTEKNDREPIFSKFSTYLAFFICI